MEINTNDINQYTCLRKGNSQRPIIVIPSIKPKPMHKPFILIKKSAINQCHTTRDNYYPKREVLPLYKPKPNSNPGLKLKPLKPSISHSRNIRSLSALIINNNNPSQSTAMTNSKGEDLTITKIDFYKEIYKYSFIKKKEKVYDPNADCDSDAHEDDIKDLEFQRLSQQYNFIPSFNRYEHLHESFKNMFRYPKIDYTRKRQNALMLQKYKQKFSKAKYNQ